MAEGWRELWATALDGPHGAALRALAAASGVDADDPEAAWASLAQRWASLGDLGAPEATARVGAWLAEVEPALRGFALPDALGGGALSEALAEAGHALRAGGEPAEGRDLQAVADALAARFGAAAEVSDALWRASIAEAAARDVRPPALGPLCEPGSLPPLPEVDLDALLAALPPSGAEPG